MIEDSTRRLNIEDLRRLCEDKEAESLTLEFKQCQELVIGTQFFDKKKREHRDRQKEDVLQELTKDVTALLNSAGGTIIYGIIEDGKSRAKSLDGDPFSSDQKDHNLSQERVSDWLRDHIQPSPTANVYSISAAGDKWYLAVEVPQGQLAYQAKDKRFYKRIGPTVKPMEQYEVADVMNRARCAALRLVMKMHPQEPMADRKWNILRLVPRVTSQNYIASEYGALKIILAFPLQFSQPWRNLGVRVQERTGLPLQQETANAQSATFRWGAHTGTVVFPGDWFDFGGRSLFLDIPSPSFLPDGTYLLQAQLFTLNGRGKEALYAIQERSSAGFTLSCVDGSQRAMIEATFWRTYHKARELLYPPAASQQDH